MPVLTEYAQTLRQKAVFANKKIIFKKKLKFCPSNLVEKLPCGYPTWLGSGGRGNLEAHTKTYFKTDKLLFISRHGQL